MKDGSNSLPLILLGVATSILIVLLHVVNVPTSLMEW
jgi:hypothetical protein